jgi:hypothetical protein
MGASVTHFRENTRYGFDTSSQFNATPKTQVRVASPSGRGLMTWKLCRGQGSLLSKTHWGFRVIPKPVVGFGAKPKPGHFNLIDASHGN